MLPFRGRVPDIVSFCVFTAVALWTSCAAADQRAPLTLAEAEDLALAGEPGGAALHAQAEALGEQAVAAGQLPDPMLRVGLANYPLESGNFSSEPMTQAQLGIRQAFPRSRTRSLGTERYSAMAEEATRSAAAREREVLQATRVEWLDTLYWQRAFEVVSESRPYFEDLVTVTRSLYSVGRKTQHDVLRAELELSRLEDRVIETGRTHAEAQARLSRWLGMDAYRPIAEKMPEWDALPLLPDLEVRLDEHPALEAADAGISAKQSAVAIAEDSRKPGWALDLAYGYREGLQQNGDPRSDFVSLNVTFDLPFFTKNRQDRRVAAALGERRAAIENRAELLARLRSRLGAEYARWSDLTRRLALYDMQILGQSSARAEAALLAYQSDAGDFADVMRAQIDDLNIRLERIRVEVERAKSYAVLANLGGLPK